MRRNNGELRDNRLTSDRLLQCVGGLLTMAAFWVAPVAGQGLVYVDANDDFVADASQPDGFRFGPNANLAPEAAFDQSAAVNRNDGLWHLRDGLGADGPSGRFVWEATGNVQAGDTGENVPLVTQTISGLTVGASYKVYAAYWSSAGESWPIRAGVAPGSLALYDRNGTQAGNTATPGLPAGSAVWATPPTISGTPAFTEADRTLYLGFAGTAVADAMGKATVYIDDLPGNSSATRTWYDGVAYLPAAFSPTLDATIDRATGVITLGNMTGQNVAITGVSITSASGALKPGSWLSIANNYDGNSGGTFDTDVWNVTAPTTPFPSAANTLTETEDASGGGTGGNLVHGGSLNFGNAWIRTPTQDVQIALTLANATVLTLTPQYTGPALVPGNFDGVGGLTAADFAILLSNLHKPLNTTTNAEAYVSGDMTGDGAVNFNDFRAFKNAFNAAHGAGAFEAMIGVPEPAAWVMLATGILSVGSWKCRRRMTSVRTLVLLLVCGLLSFGSRSACAQLTYVDANATAGTGNTGPTSAFTVGSNNQADDNLWTLRTGFASGGTIYQSGDGDGEDAPEIMTTISGLNPNSTYRVYAHFWDGSGGAPDWNIRAGFVSGNLTLFANPADAPDIGAQNAVLASTLQYATPPTVFAEADRTMYAGLVGNAPSNGSGQLTVFIDDLPSTIGVNQRSWYDGLSFEAVAALTLRVNTTTGLVSIRNSEPTTFDVDYYEIRSPLGSLNRNGWGSLDSGENNDPVGTGWDVAGGVSNNLLSEVNFTSMLSLAQNQGVSLGSAFTTSAAQDLTFFYSAPGGALVQGVVAYVSGGVPGDYNLNGVVDAADYTVWRNNLGGPAASLPNRNTGNSGPINAADYSFWKSRFGATSGSGSLAGQAAVPEPSSLLLGGVLMVLFAARPTRTGK